MLSDQFSALLGQLRSSGGFTVNPRTGSPVTSGIAVAPFGNEEKIPEDETTSAHIAAFHGLPGNMARYERGASLGGWNSKGTDYLDTPTVYPNSPGGHARARRQMLASRQISAYHLDTGVEEANPFHEDNRVLKNGKAADIVAHDTPEQRQVWQEMPRSQIARAGWEQRQRPGRTEHFQEGQSFS